MYRLCHIALWNSCSIAYFSFVVCLFCFLGLYLQHMEVPRLEVESEPQLPAYPTATAKWDPSHIFHLHHSSCQCQINNPLSRSRDWTRNLMVCSWVHYCWATTKAPHYILFEYESACVCKLSIVHNIMKSFLNITHLLSKNVACPYCFNLHLFN